MTVYRRALIILNPVSGSQEPAETRRLLEDRFSHERIAYELRETENAGDALQWARRAYDDGFDLVVVAGGDGTVMEAMSGLVKRGKDVPLAQIPAGTANLLARALGIPTTPADAVDLIFTGRAACLDVGYVPDQDRYFALIAGAGYDARLIADAPRELKNALGFGAYILSGIKNMFTLRSARIDLEIDGQRQRFRAHTVLIMNVGQIDAVGVALGPDVQPHDGQLDLMIVSSATVWGAARILLRIVTRQFKGHTDLRYLKARRARISATPPLPTEIDGEPLGTTPLTVEAIPDGALLIVPRDYQAAAAPA